MSLHRVLVFLGGEGTTEVGRADAPGVLEALLLHARREGWSVGGRMEWRQIRKYRSGDHRSAEQRNVLGLALAASELGVDILAFTRDRADIHDQDERYEAALSQARTEFPHLRIVGGLARPTIEGWVLAAHGAVGTDALSKTAAIALVGSHGITVKSREAYVDVVSVSSLELEPGHSLERWLGEARQAFTAVLG